MFLTDIGPAGALFDYGLLGIFCGIFAVVIVFLGRQFFFMLKKSEDRLKEIENDLQKYLAEDRAAIIETLKDCKEALRNNNRVTEKIIRILENTKI
jgi:regulatory protein YycI of two-component signal transduction system YycFG